jgi:hypothetical protein
VLREQVTLHVHRWNKCNGYHTLADQLIYVVYLYVHVLPITEIPDSFRSVGRTCVALAEHSCKALCMTTLLHEISDPFFSRGISKRLVYSASDDDRVNFLCFVLLEPISEPPVVVVFPLTENLSDTPAQSAVSVSDQLPFSALYDKTWSRVSLRCLGGRFKLPSI